MEDSEVALPAFESSHQTIPKKPKLSSNSLLFLFRSSILKALKLFQKKNKPKIIQL